tara:strand:- start:74 stop:568 length:495 start_codon:yes stop_codon:yes gene_type:complete
MAHFAKLDLNNIVQNVIVVSNEMLEDSEGNEVEQLGINFCKSLYGENTNWVQTSYNSNIRKQYAGVGYTYDTTNDVFIIPQPFSSWTLNSEFNWVSPVDYPTNGKTYGWNEKTQSWDLFTPDSPYPSWTWNETEWMWAAPVAHPEDEQPYQWNEENLNWELITE